MPGHGTEKHESIFKSVRTFLSSCESVSLCIGDDNLMSRCLDKDKYGVSEQYPDLVFYTHDCEHPVIVEIGTYNPDKWTEPVIHIGFSLDVSNIGKLSKQAEKLSSLLSNYLNYGE